MVGLRRPSRPCGSMRFRLTAHHAHGGPEARARAGRLTTFVALLASSVQPLDKEGLS